VGLSSVDGEDSLLCLLIYVCHCLLSTVSVSDVDRMFSIAQTASAEWAAALCGRGVVRLSWRSGRNRERVTNPPPSRAPLERAAGGRGGGAITAALFIGEFVEGKPWIHLDIAGNAMTDTEGPYTPKGGTGTMVRSLVKYVESQG
jgi:hypothetical protein